MKCPKCKSDITAGVKKCPVCEGKIIYKVKASSKVVSAFSDDEKITEAIDISDYLKTFQLEETLSELVDETQKLIDLRKEKSGLKHIYEKIPYNPPKRPEFRRPDGKPAYIPPKMPSHPVLRAFFASFFGGFLISVLSFGLILPISAFLVGLTGRDYRNVTGEPLKLALLIIAIIFIGVFIFLIRDHWNQYEFRKGRIEAYNKEKERYKIVFEAENERHKQLLNSYEEELVEYKESYNKKVKKNEEEYNKETQRINEAIDECSFNLELLYKNVNIPERHQNITALRAFHKYISSGLCNCLEGEDGAIARYEINGK